MMEKRCIIIDDEPQDESIEILISTLAKDGIHLKCLQLNPKDKQFRKNIGSLASPEYAIDFGLVMEKLASPEYYRKRVDLIACDYNLEDDEINGFEVISALRADNYKREIILYSGSHDAVIGKILDEPNHGERVRKIKRLAASNIAHITDRVDYKAALIGCIRADDFSLESLLEQLLEPYEKFYFNDTLAPLRGKEVKEVLDEIKAGTAAGKSFQKLILENAIANLIDFEC